VKVLISGGTGLITRAFAAVGGNERTFPWAEGVRWVVDWLDEHGKIDSSEEPAFYDQILAAWECLSDEMAHELADLGPSSNKA
jgi:hypothetical protein